MARTSVGEMSGGLRVMGNAGDHRHVQSALAISPRRYGLSLADDDQTKVPAGRSKLSRG